MAGDWIKVETAIGDKPEVFAIADTLMMEDPDAVVGKLVRVWAWFDAHTVDGNAPSVTRLLLDRLTGVKGFTEAMIRVGWLTETADSLQIANFDRHNGETAKKRALTAKRTAKHRAKRNAESNADDVTSALPREDNREDIKTTPNPTANRGGHSSQCDKKTKPHQNCRGCGTNKRARAKAEEAAKPRTATDWKIWGAAHDLPIGPSEALHDYALRAEREYNQRRAH